MFYAANEANKRNCCKISNMRVIELQFISNALELCEIYEVINLIELL